MTDPNFSPAPTPATPGGGAPAGGNGWRTGFIIVAIIAGLAIIAAVIWGVMAATAGSNAAPAPATTTATPTPTPTPTSTSTPTPTPTSTSAAVTACKTDNLQIKTGQAQGTAGSNVLPLIFINIGSSKCTMSGYPRVAFVGDGNGTQIGTEATPDPSSSVGSYALAPGDSVQALLTIAEAGNFDNCNPQAVDGFRVYPPDASGAAFVADTAYQACTTGTGAAQQLKIGAAQTN
jgi:hypothetical protein